MPDGVKNNAGAGGVRGNIHVRIDNGCNEQLIQKGYAVGKHHMAWLTYVVSAPFSSKGSPFFLPKAYDGTMGWNYCMSAMAGTIDLIYHVLLWVAILIMDCWVANLPHRGEDAHSIGDMYAEEIQWGATVCTILVWIGLVISIIFGFLGQIPGSAWPSTVSLMRGGAIGGIVFSSLYALKLMMMVGGGPHDTANNWNVVTAEPEITVRQLTLWVIGLKCLALTCLDANLNYFGPVTEPELANVCGLSADYEKTGEGEPPAKFVAGPFGNARYVQEYDAKNSTSA